MKELVQFLAQQLVNNPTAVEVKETQGDTASVLELRVAKEDLGRVISVHGLRGGVRFRPDNPDSESVQVLKQVFLAEEDAHSGAALKSREYRIDKVTPLGRGTIRLMFEGITDVDQAEALKGKTVFADQRDLPPPEPHEFYYHEAVGCEVVLTDGRRIGTIEEVFSAG